MIRSFHLLVSFILALWAAATLTASPASKPNIVYILADDLGYGDVQALNPERGKIKTPHLDRLVAQGMAFTDAHSGSSVCTPTRYGLLTGRYAWRTHLQQGVLDGTDDDPLIAANRLTVPALLKQHGYATAAIGKWHLGFTSERPASAATGAPAPASAAKKSKIGRGRSPPRLAHRRRPDHARLRLFLGLLRRPHDVRAHRAGPRRRESPAHRDAPAPRAPSCALHLRSRRRREIRPAVFPLRSAHFAAHADSSDARVAGEKRPRGLRRLRDADRRRRRKNPRRPRCPWPRGKQLVVFTADNGCSPAAGTPALEKQGHFASAQFRGYKADIWDGGHRVPFFARWPGRIAAASTSAQLICHVDLLATCAELLAATLPANAGEDSVSILPALLGTDRAPLREAVVHHSIHGMFSIRQGSWKLELCPGSGGWAAPLDAAARQAGLPEIQLYDLAADIAETKNLHAENPAIVARLRALLDSTIAEGRSTPGPKQTNDVAIDLLKSKASAPSP